MRKQISVILLCMLLAVSLIAGCSNSRPAPAANDPASAPGAPKELTKIKISTIAGPSWASLFVANNEGLFAKYGLEVEFTLPGGPKGFQAMHAGECEFAMLSQEPLLIAQEQGIRSKILATMLKSRVYGIIAHPDITEISQLKGAVIFGSDPGSAPFTFTQTVLRDGGINPDKDVTFMQMPMDAAVAGLDKGEIKAAFINISKLPELKDLEFNTLVNTTREADSLKYLGNDEFPAEMICTTEEYAQKNPEVCQNLVNAIIEAQLWIKDHTDREVAQSIAKDLIALPLDILAEEIAIMRDVYSTDCFVSEAGQQAVIDMLVSSGVIKTNIPYADVVDMTFVNNYGK
ncbi:MAG: ABC transporter substrate-binding protein [Clostridia bacterium]|jgi:NitT/TauT family transport system substrate-binding protein|nr:ABC transporter substrate-binding protein [Clostridia bacterium]